MPIDSDCIFSVSDDRSFFTEIQQFQSDMLGQFKISQCMVSHIDLIQFLQLQHISVKTQRSFQIRNIDCNVIQSCDSHHNLLPVEYSRLKSSAASAVGIMPASGMPSGSQKNRSLFYDDIPSLRVGIEIHRSDQDKTDDDILPQRVNSHHVQAGGNRGDGNYA